MNVFPRLLPLLCTLVVAAQIFGLGVASGASADDELLAEYRLKDARVEQWAQATRNLVRAFRDNPELACAQDKVEGDKASIGDIADWYDSKPEIKEAINSAGMSSQEYTTFLFSMIQAGMGAWVAEQQGLDKLPESVPKENVEYYIINKEEADRIGQPTREARTQAISAASVARERIPDHLAARRLPQPIQSQALAFVKQSPGA